MVQVEVIDLINDGSGLGFGIVGCKGIGVIIKTIIAGSVSARVGVGAFCLFYFILLFYFVVMFSL